MENLASTIRGIFKYGRAVGAHDIPKPDLIVEGSVAVDMRGYRLGKDYGYGDVEIKSLKSMFGFTPIVTTIHDLQVVAAVPTEERDEKISIVVTPTRVIRVTNVPKWRIRF